MEHGGTLPQESVHALLLILGSKGDGGQVFLQL